MICDQADWQWVYNHWFSRVRRVLGWKILKKSPSSFLMKHIFSERTIFQGPGTEILQSSINALSNRVILIGSSRVAKTSTFSWNSLFQWMLQFCLYQCQCHKLGIIMWHGVGLYKIELINLTTLPDYIYIQVLVMFISLEFWWIDISKPYNMKF